MLLLLLFWVDLFVSVLGLKPRALHLEDKRSISLHLFVPRETTWLGNEESLGCPLSVEN